MKRVKYFLVVRRTADSRAVRQSFKILDKLLDRHHLNKLLSVNNETCFATLQVVVEATVGVDKLSYILSIIINMRFWMAVAYLGQARRWRKP